MDFSNLTDEIAALAHRCWCKRMLEEGWQPGKVLDPEGMTHDALRPYRDLTPEDQARLRQRVTWDEFEQELADSISGALEKRDLSARDIYVGMRVRVVGGDRSRMATDPWYRVEHAAAARTKLMSSSCRHRRRARLRRADRETIGRGGP